MSLDKSAKPGWEIARGKRAWGEVRLLWDTHYRVHRSTRVLALPVRHLEYQGQLWLVIVRQGKGREPWYLLTNKRVETEDQAGELVFSYTRRWKIEEQFRFHKTELLIESLRLRDWEPRRKLLLLVTLAYGFLLSLLAPNLCLDRARLLLHWVPRADWRQWTAIDSAGPSIGCGSLMLPLSRHLDGGPFVPSPISPGHPVQSAGG